ncbi:MAG: hypothetical protein Kow0026_16060 [Oricola sp.]
MSYEGRVDIVLPRVPEGGVAVHYRRPADISALLTGKQPQEAIRAISAIYGICANAQAHAAALALEAALGTAADPRTASARALVTAMENLRENVLRIALDWPRLAGRAPAGASVRKAMAFVPAMRAALFGAADPFLPGAMARPDRSAARALIADAEALLVEAVFGEPLDFWSRRRGNLGIVSWAVGTRTPAAALIARLFEKGWAVAAEIDGWRGDVRDIALPAETTLFSRRAQAGPVSSLGSAGLGARFVARLAELACLPGEMRLLLDGKTAPNAVSRTAAGSGIGIVDAARGRLVHRARLGGGLVCEYRIVSPTDRNFDAGGVAERCLSALDGRYEAEDRIELAHLVVNVIDPCVAYEVRHC